MFKVHAASVEECFRFDPAREHSLRELDAVIRVAAPSLSRAAMALARAREGLTSASGRG
jgi:hypothetical protein